MNTVEFQNWILLNNIVERTKKSFWNYVENYRNEEPEEFSEVFSDVNMDSLEITISKVSFTVNYSFDEPITFIAAFADIEYEDREIGVYESLYSLDGDDLDDDYLRLKD